MTRAAVDIIQLVCEPLAHRGPYDFGGLRPHRARARSRLAMVFGQGLRSPPPETIFLHRKLLGTFQICARLRAHVNVHALIERFVR